MEKIDLHLHTNLSDGTLTPEQVIYLAYKNGCKKIAITDHDYAGNYKEYENKYKIKILSGIEFNTATTNMHILGYGIDDANKVNDSLKEIKLVNEKICYKIIENMKNDGYDISIDKVINYLNSIGINTDILDKRKIVKYLIYKKYSNGILDTYNNLIGVNQKYYIPNKKISPKDIIKLINDCNGVSVLAHPNMLMLNEYDFLKQIEKLQEYGLSGIEIINEKLKLCNNLNYSKIADSQGLIKTVGSDFHEPTDCLGIKTNKDIYINLHKKILEKRK